MAVLENEPLVRTRSHSQDSLGREEQQPFYVTKHRNYGTAEELSDTYSGGKRCSFGKIVVILLFITLFLLWGIVIWHIVRIVNK